MVLGSSENSTLVEVLFDMGFAPLVREDMGAALDKLRSESLAAVVVDRGHSNVDVLEFLLNVRDVDERVPIVVIGCAPDGGSDCMLRAVSGTVVVGESGDSRLLARELKKALSAQEPRGERKPARPRKHGGGIARKADDRREQQ